MEVVEPDYGHTKDQALAKTLHEIFGVDLTKIPGVAPQTVLTLLAEAGSDLSRWPSAQAFGSWLGLCPQNKISGGKVLSSRSKRSNNKAAMALRMSAQSLYRSDNYIASFHIRMKMRKNSAKATTATAYKLARIIWACVTNGTEYDEQGSEQFKRQLQERKMRRLKKLAKELDVEITQAA